MEKQVILLDGGMGDEICKRLHTSEAEWSSPGLMNVANHALVLQLHKEFARAGSDYITTANFSCRRHNGFSDEQVKFACESAGRIARRAAEEVTRETGRVIRVLGSLPPLLDCFRSDTQVTEDADEQYKVMIESLLPFVDFFIGETLSSSAEATQVLKCVSMMRRRCWVSFSVTAEGYLYSGEVPSKAILRLLSSDGCKPSAILFNCSSPEAIEKALENIRVCDIQGCQLGVYPNRYLPVSAEWTSLDQPARSELTAEELNKFCIRCVRNHRVTIVGGCCGISSEYIRALRTVLSMNS